MQSALPSSLPLGHSSKSIQETLTGKVVLSIAATGLVAICAHISLPLPFTLVPLTLQTFAVIFIGMLLGPVAGFLSMALYLAEGASGLPVFSPYGPGGAAQLLGPTAGYLLSYPLAAALAGFAVRVTRGITSRFTSGIIAGTLASLPIFILGAAWLAHLLHIGTTSAWHLAIAPFLPGEAIKVTAAAAIFSSLRRWRQS
jgi:biotin transport system substrate-specific component